MKKLKTAYKTVKEWLKERGFKNVLWLVAFLLAFLIFGQNSIFYAFGFVALGIFIEKNRKSLAQLYKEIKNRKQ